MSILSPAQIAGQYIGLFTAAAAFEFSYVAWGRAVARDRTAATVFYSVLVAALGLLGLKGALELSYGWIPYLSGIGAGAYASARLGRMGRMNPDTYGPASGP